jgi:predicted nuclease of predicted toxin-antitoxin system
MRILVDECLDERLRSSFSGHDCQTARYAGFAGLKNGELLNAAESARFEVLLTADQGLEYEQNLTGRKIAIIIFHAKSIRLKDLLPHIPACLAVLPSIKSGEIIRIPDNRS